jgi:hypothetical protein
VPRHWSGSPMRSCIKAPVCAIRGPSCTSAGRPTGRAMARSRTPSSGTCAPALARRRRWLPRRWIRYLWRCASDR